MELRVVNIEGEEYVNVNDLINDFVEQWAVACDEGDYFNITDEDDAAADTFIRYLRCRRRDDLANKLKREWIRKRFGNYF